MVLESRWASALWRKSRRSSGATGCVEFAVVADLVGVRDSKDPAGPVLAFDRPDWRDFVDVLKQGRLTA